MLPAETTSKKREIQDGSPAFLAVTFYDHGVRLVLCMQKRLREEGRALAIVRRPVTIVGHILYSRGLSLVDFRIILGRCPWPPEGRSDGGG